MPPDTLPGANGPRPVGEMLRLADGARDAGRWAQAAALYHEALETGCSDPAIRVQLGNMLKEAGELLEAESAYRAALDEVPGSADAWLQLGHVLKLLGRREAAVDAYERSLALDAARSEAARELLALGSGWRIAEANPSGRLLLHEVVATVHDLRHALDVLERHLPMLESLAGVPPERLDLYRRRYRPCAPEAPNRAPVDLVFAAGDAPVGLVASAFAASGASLATAGTALRSVCVVSPHPASLEAGDRLLRPVAPSLVLQGGGRVPDGPDDGWVLIVAGAAALCATAVSWFSHVAAVVGPGVAALIADEVGAAAPGDGARPVLLPGFDAWSLAASGHSPSVVAVRRALLRLAGEGAGSGALLHGLRRGQVVHVPRMLSEQLGSPPPVAALPRAWVSSPPPLTIRVVVPTRTSGELLERCYRSAVGRAARPGLLRWTIVDNRSLDGADPVLEAIAAVSGSLVRRRPEAFNWSAFNNGAAAEASEDVLLFLNDDVELLTRGWDLAVAAALADRDVGAVGLKLLYPDGRVQHAGIVMGLGGLAEHEGRGAERGAPGPLRRWVSRRRAAAVTGAALACRGDVFREVGGFDAERLPVWFNDVDFCLRVRGTGREVHLLGDVEGVHLESQSVRQSIGGSEREALWADAVRTMRVRWGTALDEDPTYNPHYCLTGRPFESISEPGPERTRLWLEMQTRQAAWTS